MSYEANTSANARTAAVSVTAEGIESVVIHVNQMSAAPAITSAKTVLQEKAAGQKDSILITSNVPWNLTIPGSAASWLKADKVADSAGTTSVIFTVSENTSILSRTAVINFSSTWPGTPPLEITVNQEQPDVVIEYFTHYAAGGSTITINGSGFSFVPTQNKVFINGVAATVQRATPYTLDVQVPPKVGSGPLIVAVNTKADTSEYNFTYKWTGVVTTFVGGTEGYADGVGTNAKLRHPAGMHFDAAGNLYVADYANYKVRKITPSGEVSTLPGRFLGDQGLKTDFGLPSDVTIDQWGNIYVVEVNSNGVSKITPDGTVMMIAGGNAPGYADGVGAAASFYWPAGLEVDGAGNVYVADARNNRIRKIAPDRTVTTLLTNVSFNLPFGMRWDAAGNLILTDSWRNKIRKVTTAGVVTDVAGSGGGSSMDGPAATAGIPEPEGIAIDKTGNIFVGDNNGAIRWITPGGDVRTIATPDRFTLIQGIAVDNAGTLFVADYYNNKIVKVTIQ